MAGPERGPSIDRALVRLLDRLPRVAFEGRVCRQLAPGYHPLSGEGARIHGGRWNPPDSFAVLYTAPEPATCLAELARAARLQGLRPADLLPRRLVTYEVRLVRVLDLTDESVLAALGVTTETVVGDDPRRPRAIGAAAHFVAFEALRAPSAARPGAVPLPIFIEQLSAASRVDVGASEELALDLERDEERAEERAA
ncbi:MAG: RES family NAD+ phosphorylase [Candidatus Limnocylindrales bacterium]